MKIEKLLGEPDQLGITRAMITEPCPSCKKEMVGTALVRIPATIIRHEKSECRWCGQQMITASINQTKMLGLP